jgi:hypothetical protein
MPVEKKLKKETGPGCSGAVGSAFLNFFQQASLAVKNTFDCSCVSGK